MKVNRKFLKYYTVFVFGLTIIPYVLVKIPPFSDYIGHLYFSFYSGGANDPYTHQFHLSYQFIDTLLTLIRMVFQTPARTSVVFFVLNNILMISIFYLFLKILEFNKKIILPFIFLYPLGQFSVSYYWGLIPFVTSSMFWALFILLYLNRQEKTITFKFFIILAFIEFITFFSHPLSSLFMILALFVFFLKAIINKEKNNIVYLILFAIEVVYLSFIFKMSLPSRFGNASITSIFINKDLFSVILTRFNYAISNLNTKDFPKLSGVSILPATLLSLIKTLGYLSSFILILISFKKFSIKSSRFYLVLIIFILNVIYFFVVDRYDQASMLPIRVLDYYEIMRFGGLLYLISLIMGKNLTKFLANHTRSISMLFGLVSLFFVYSLIHQAGNIHKLVVSTVVQTIRCTEKERNKEKVLYNYDLKYDAWFKRAIAVAATLNIELKNKKIVIRNEWADACTHCPLVWNNSFDTNRSVGRRLKFDYNKDLVRVSCK